MQTKTEKVKRPAWIRVFGVGSIMVGISLGYFLNFWVVLTLFVCAFLYTRISNRAQWDIALLGLLDLRRQAVYIFGIQIVVVAIIVAGLCKVYDLGALKYLKQSSVYILR